MRRVFPVAKALLVCLTATTFGCGAPQLIPTPSLFVGSEENPFADVPEAFQSNKVDVLYVTDRRPITEEGGGEEQEKIRYDWGRSLSLAFGSAMVEFGEDVPWETLVVESRTDDRSLSLPVVVSEISERGRFPDTPMAVVRNDTGGMSPDPQALIRHTNVVEQFHRELNARLALTPKKEAYIYVHGYNNSFDDAVTVMAQLWHFLGRQGIPIAYTWPAGVGGLRGYFYDRESGEFTIYHLKQFLKALITCDGLERVHFVAHSRGTDVLISALRELFIEMRQETLDGTRGVRIRNIVLAAPDLDLEVISQRIVAEGFMHIAERLTIYMSTTDVALGLSTWLFLSQRRVGRVQFADLPPSLQKIAEKTTRLSLIDARVSSGFIGHSYFYSHPAVLSDLILVLRDNRPPGKEHGRPLEKLDVASWRIGDDYPKASVEDPSETDGDE